jgi:hypothetical protein
LARRQRLLGRRHDGLPIKASASWVLGGGDSDGDRRPVKSPLFEDRAPEAAATQLAIVLAWIAECELATLEYYQGTKSAPKHELRRHESICKDLVYHCRDLKVPPRGLLGRACPRLEKAMNEISALKQ